MFCLPLFSCRFLLLIFFFIFSLFYFYFIFLGGGGGGGGRERGHLPLFSSSIRFAVVSAVNVYSFNIFTELH